MVIYYGRVCNLGVLFFFLLVSLHQSNCFVHLVLSSVFRSELANSLASSPDFRFTDLSELFLELFTVVGLGVTVKRTGSFGTILDGSVEVFKDRLGGIMERLPPIKSTTHGSSRTV